MRLNFLHRVPIFIYNDALRKFMSTEEKNIPVEMLEINWGAAPLLCFQNEPQSESALEVRKF